MGVCGVLVTLAKSMPTTPAEMHVTLGAMHVETANDLGHRNLATWAPADVCHGCQVKVGAFLGKLKGILKVLTGHVPVPCHWLFADLLARHTIGGQTDITLPLLHILV